MAALLHELELATKCRCSCKVSRVPRPSYYSVFNVAFSHMAKHGSMEMRIIDPMSPSV